MLSENKIESSKGKEMKATNAEQFNPVNPENLAFTGSLMSLKSDDRNWLLKIASNYYIVVQKPPHPWHRFWQRVLLGWEWQEKAK